MINQNIMQIIHRKGMKMFPHPLKIILSYFIYDCDMIWSLFRLYIPTTDRLERLDKIRKIYRNKRNLHIYCIENYYIPEGSW